MTTKRLYLLGPRGMLGQMVRRYFERRPGWTVHPVDARFDHANLIDHFRIHDEEPPALFINGIGAIPQKMSHAEDFVLPNILIPMELARSLAPHHVLIHPSTDCVFRGDRGKPYSPGTRPDASDAYGWSKIQGERALESRPNTLVMRTSIIGPSDSASSGLLQWFLSQPPKVALKGYTNHLWNGLTTLQWCVELERLIVMPLAAMRRLQLGSARACSKYEMLCHFRDAFRPDITVEPVEHDGPVDRRLQPEIVVPDLPEQLADLARFVKEPV